MYYSVYILNSYNGGRYKATFLLLILKAWHVLTQNRGFSVKLTTVICGPNSLV